MFAAVGANVKFAAIALLAIAVLACLGDRRARRDPGHAARRYRGSACSSRQTLAHRRQRPGCAGFAGAGFAEAAMVFSISILD